MGLFNIFKKQIDDVKNQASEIKAGDIFKKSIDIVKERVETVKEERDEIERRNQEYIEQVKQGINMPVFEPPQGILLTKNEVMHFACLCKYLLVKEEKAFGYGGARVKVTKSLTLSSGLGKGISSKSVQQIKGNCIITNKKIMFIPLLNDQGFNIPLNKLETYQIYKDGITLRTSKSTYPIEFEKKDKDNIELVEMVLLGALKNIE